MTPRQQFARATTVFEGVALDNPTARGVQRFNVDHYLKGRGPRIVRVQTGVLKRRDGSEHLTSVSVIVRRGQRWRIYAKGTPAAIMGTTVCDGSRRR